MSTEFGHHITSFPGAGYEWAGISTAPYQVAMLCSGFPGGQVTDISCYVASHHGGGSTSMKMALWNSSGALVLASGAFSVGAGGGANSGQSYQHASITPTFVAAGNYYIGWWRDPAGSFETSWASGGTYVHSSGNPVGSLNTGLSSQAGSLGVYLLYNPGAAYVRRSGAWVTTQPTVQRSGTKTAAIPYVRRSGVWVPGN